jgi:hypothetical protein
VSAKAGWYPDPGGGVGLYRYWDGKAWSAATSPNPAAPPPVAPLGFGTAPGAGQPDGATSGYGTSQGGYGTSQGGYGTSQGGYGTAGGSYGPGSYGTGTYGQQPGEQNAYASFQQQAKKRTPVGWWIGAAALLVVIVVVAVVAIRAIGNGTLAGGAGGGQPTEQVCPPETSVTSPIPHPNDGRVYGGPLSYPRLGDPWGAPQSEDRVPFGSDVSTQVVLVEPNYQPNSNWVASILIGELQAGDGFYTPEQGSQIVVKCILGKFYGDNPVTSDVKVNQATTIDGHEGWLVESQLSFDISGLKTKGELLIVAIVSAGDRSGLYYASIPDTTPELVPTAREVLQELKVEG